MPPLGWELSAYGTLLGSSRFWFWNLVGVSGALWDVLRGSFQDSLLTSGYGSPRTFFAGGGCRPIVAGCSLLEVIDFTLTKPILVQLKLTLLLLLLLLLLP